MTFMAVKDLKRTQRLWRRLRAERELVVTRDGKPCAILVGIDSASCEGALAEIRRAMFSAAVSKIRNRAAKRPPAPTTVAKAVAESRRARGLR